jgi:hydroxymethylpyrimidine/phosphomethylpyrimidine kinase
MVPVALTIAGSDPGGGAGIQADLKTFHQLGVYGTSVITLVTVQNTVRVSRVELLDPALVTEQIRAVLEDLPPGAVKTGALGGAEIIEAVASIEFGCPLIVDPVMISKHRAPLVAAEARAVLRRLLVPRASLITPNAEEAADLAGIEIRDIETMREAARRIAGLGARAVLVKGGHVPPSAILGDATDILFDGREFLELRAPRIETRHTHGTGCSYSAAITAWLARGWGLADSVRRAKCWIAEAIATNPGLGAGHGPLNHWARAGTGSPDPL